MIMVRATSLSVSLRSAAFFLLLFAHDLPAQGVGISETSITPDASAVLEVRSNSRGLLLPRLANSSIASPVRGLLIYNGTTDGNPLSFHNGTSWDTLATVDVLVAVRVFTGGSPYTPTAGTTSFVVYAVGGGGQGGGCAASGGSAGAGGGSGGVVIKRYFYTSGSYAFAIGAAGTGAAAGANGNAGGATTFDVLNAGGGSGGTAGNATTSQVRTGGAGGTATGGDINIPGMAGGHSVRLANAVTGGLTGNGGSTIFGNGGMGRTGVTGAGFAGTGNGSGGGGAHGATSSAGGAGTAGVIIIYEYK